MILKHAVNSLAETECTAVNGNRSKTAHIDRNGDSVARKVSAKFIRFRQKINFIAGMQPVARNKNEWQGLNLPLSNSPTSTPRDSMRSLSRFS